MEAAYAYLSPASRQVMSLEKFKSSMRRGTFRDARIETVTCEGDVCNVRLILTYDHRMMKGISTPIGEAWVFEVSPVTAYAFAKGEYSHTRFRF